MDDDDILDRNIIDQNESESSSEEFERYEQE